MIGEITGLRINQLSKFKINSYPNPSSDNINMEVISDIRIEDLEVSIFNELDQFVKVLQNKSIYNYHFEWARRDENGSMMPAGIYFVRVKTLDGLIVKKVVVN